jgi:hypothetical protein
VKRAKKNREKSKQKQHDKHCSSGDDDGGYGNDSNGGDEDTDSPPNKYISAKAPKGKSGGGKSCGKPVSGGDDDDDDDDDGDGDGGRPSPSQYYPPTLVRPPNIAPTVNNPPAYIPGGDDGAGGAPFRYEFAMVSPPV